jgi:hypothetical protein
MLEKVKQMKYFVPLSYVGVFFGGSLWDGIMWNKWMRVAPLRLFDFVMVSVALLCCVYIGWGLDLKENEK